MARHLLIGSGVDSAVSSGVEADGAITVQKLSATGPTDMVPGDTISDSAQVRFMQGTSGNNIVTPWIYGKDVFHFGGIAYATSSDQSSSCLMVAATNSTDIVTTMSFVDLTGGGKAGVHGGLPFTPDAKKFNITTNSGGTNTATEMADALGAQMITAGTSGSFGATSFANGPDFIDTVANDGSGTLTFVGFSPGDTDRKGNLVKEVTQFKVVFSSNAQATGGSMTVVDTAAQRGWGDGLYMRKLEESLMGANYGYYNRVQQPVAPSSTASKTATYDTYNIVATKDGSSASQINGVDNVIDITVALPTDSSGAGSAYGLIFEGKLNPYMNSAGFASVNL